MTFHDETALPVREQSNRIHRLKPQIKWTNEMLDAMERYALAGRNPEYIAEALCEEFGEPITRNAVLGKFFRSYGGMRRFVANATEFRAITQSKLKRTPKPKRPQLTRSQKIQAWAAIALHGSQGPICTMPDCGAPKQANRYGLCAEHDRQRLRDTVTRENDCVEIFEGVAG